jgi:hypothetical protein
VVTTAAGQPVRLVSNCHFRPRDRHRWRGRPAPPSCADRGGASAFAAPRCPRLGRPSSDPSQGGWPCPIGVMYVLRCPLHSPASARAGEEIRAVFLLRLLSANGGGRCDWPTRRGPTWYVFGTCSSGARGNTHPRRAWKVEGRTSRLIIRKSDPLWRERPESFFRQEIFVPRNGHNVILSVQR